MFLRWLCLLLALLPVPAAFAQVLPVPAPRLLPPALGKGGGAALLVPSARTDGLAAHIRGVLLLEDLGAPDFHFGLDLGLSTSLWHWAEVGATLHMTARNSPEACKGCGIDLRQGPVTLWGRFSPPVFTDYEHDGWSLAGQVEYAVARGTFDGGGQLAPDAQTWALVAEYRKWRLLGNLSGAYQMADGDKYRGVQGGGALWLTLVRSAGLQIGGEVLGRAGAWQGEGVRAGWTALVGFSILEGEGIAGGATYLRGDGEMFPASSVGMMMGYSVGPGYKRPPRTWDYERMQEAAWRQANWRALAGAAMWLAGYRDPIVGSDGYIYSDDGKQRLARLGMPDPFRPGFILPDLEPGRWVRVGESVYLRSPDGAVRSLDGAWLGRSVMLDPKRATDQAIRFAQQAAELAERQAELQRAAACPYCRPSLMPNYGDGQAGEYAGCALVRWAGCRIKPWDLSAQAAAGGGLPPPSIGAAAASAAARAAKQQAWPPRGRWSFQDPPPWSTPPAAAGQTPARAGRNPGGATGGGDSPPNPHGSPGAPDHQATVEELLKQARREHPDENRHEIRGNRSIEPETGLRRRPDAAVIDTATGRVVKVYEAARANKDGETPVSRERKKVQEYDGKGIPSHVEIVR